MKAGFKIVDVDIHIMEDLEECRKLLDEPYRHRGGELIPNDAWDRSVMGKRGSRLGVVSNPVTTPKELLSAMDLEGIDVGVIFPTMGLGLARVREPKVAATIAKAYNTHVSAYHKADGSRLHGLALLSPLTPKVAAQELERTVSDLGFIGGFLPAHNYGINFGLEDFYPIYEMAEKLDVPILFHGGASHDSVGVEYFSTFACVHGAAHPFQQMICIANVLTNGILEVFSKLRVGFFEAGIGWVPYWMERLDEEYEKRGEVEMPLIKAPPSEYVRSGRVYFTCEPEERTVPFVAQFIGQKGEDVICYTSDWPHWDSEFPKTAASVIHRRDLSESLKRKILGENSKTLYKIKL